LNQEGRQGFSGRSGLRSAQRRLYGPPAGKQQQSKHYRRPRKRAARRLRRTPRV